MVHLEGWWSIAGLGGVTGVWGHERGITDAAMGHVEASDTLHASSDQP